MTGAPYACAAQFVCVGLGPDLDDIGRAARCVDRLGLQRLRRDGMLAGLRRRSTTSQRRDDLAGDDGDVEPAARRAAPLDEMAAPLRGPAPVPLPAICDAQPAAERDARRDRDRGQDLDDAHDCLSRRTASR